MSSFRESITPRSDEEFEALVKDRATHYLRCRFPYDKPELVEAHDCVDYCNIEVTFRLPRLTGDIRHVCTFEP